MGTRVSGASIIAIVLVGVVAVFQVALAAGAPLGAAAWGGRHPGVLPAGFRVASGIAGLVVYPGIAWLIATVDITGAPWLPWSGSSVLWALVGLFGAGAVANAASRSRIERLWAPVSLGLAVCCAVIAVSA